MISRFIRELVASSFWSNTLAVNDPNNSSSCHLFYGNCSVVAYLLVPAIWRFSYLGDDTRVILELFEYSNNKFATKYPCFIQLCFNMLTVYFKLRKIVGAYPLFSTMEIKQ